MKSGGCCRLTAVMKACLVWFGAGRCVGRGCAGAGAGTRASAGAGA